MPRSAPLVALVWQRTDFRESSRVVTLFTREHGKVRAFAKGAHRADSNLLGRVDFLNLVRVELWRRGQTMPLLSRADLLHEPRRLREPIRFMIANHLVQMVDAALPDERADPPLFDLVHGGLLLLQRCPASALATVVCGLEWRFLRDLGMQPDVDACAETGTPLDADAKVVMHANGRGFVAHAGSPHGLAVSNAVRDALRTLGQTPGKGWPSVAFAKATTTATLRVLGRLVAAAIERAPTARTAAVAALGSAAATFEDIPGRSPLGSPSPPGSGL